MLTSVAKYLIYIFPIQFKQIVSLQLILNVCLSFVCFADKRKGQLVIIRLGATYHSLHLLLDIYHIHAWMQTASQFATVWCSLEEFEMLVHNLLLQFQRYATLSSIQ